MKHPDTLRLDEILRRLKLGDGMPLGYVPSFGRKRWLARTRKMSFFADPRKALDAMRAEREVYLMPRVTRPSGVVPLRKKAR